MENVQTNMPMAKAEDKKAFYKAQTNPNFSLKDEKEITIKYFIVSEYPTETGEMAKRTVLINEDGVSYVSISQGIGNSILEINEFIGFATPVKCNITEVKTKSGKTLKKLVVV